MVRPGPAAGRSVLNIQDDLHMPAAAKLADSRPGIVPQPQVVVPDATHDEPSYRAQRVDGLLLAHAHHRLDHVRLDGLIGGASLHGGGRVGAQRPVKFDSQLVKALHGQAERGLVNDDAIPDLPPERMQLMDRNHGTRPERRDRDGRDHHRGGQREPPSP
jgi:hypothetical protein